MVLNDEEQCISVARFFMREYMHCSDSYRIMAALCRVCQAPSSWYSSGPAQKFILRQIRILDQATTGHSGPGGDGTGSAELDVCLLTIYGHIMFTTASYTYALSKSNNPPNIGHRCSVGGSELTCSLRLLHAGRLHRPDQPDDQP